MRKPCDASLTRMDHALLCLAVAGTTVALWCACAAQAEREDLEAAPEIKARGQSGVWTHTMLESRRWTGQIYSIGAMGVELEAEE